MRRRWSDSSGFVLAAGRHRLLLLVLCGLLAAASGCVIIYQEAEVEEIERTAEGDTVAVQSPVRAHLINGDVVVFAGGATFLHTEIQARGRTGRRYNIDYSQSSPLISIPMDSVAAVETLESGFDTDRSVAVSLLASIGVALATPVVMVALFGSCPTVYSDGPDGPVLEAEAFPNSIAPLFEVRDVDRTGAAATPSGQVELTVRNEALETHYINHLELVEIVHPPGAFVVPAPDGLAYILDDFEEPARALDRAGRDVHAALVTSDETVFRSATETLSRATPDDLFDHIDLTFAAPSDERAAVVLRLRNSLLNTVYFYDYMLAGQGARSLDWIGRDLASISGAVGVGEFYARNMGLRVQVWDGQAFVEVGRVGEVGPIAFDDVAVEVPVHEEDSLRVRLRFVTDAWRIDRAALAHSVQQSPVRRVPVQTIESSDTVPEQAVSLLASPDTSYLITFPGTQFRATFDVSPEPPEGTRTFFVALQGYYTEWMRRDWLKAPDPGTPFRPSEESLHAAMKRWQQVAPEFEAQFEATKIPVR